MLSERGLSLLGIKPMQAEIFGSTLFDENFCFAPMHLHAVFNELKLNRFLCVVCNLRLASLLRGV